MTFRKYIYFSKIHNEKTVCIHKMPIKTPIFYDKTENGRYVLKDCVIGCGLLFLILNFIILAVVLGFTANWQANGISANINGEVVCAPLSVGQSFISMSHDVITKK